MHKLKHHIKRHHRKYLFGTIILMLGFLSMLYLPSNNIKTYADDFNPISISGLKLRLDAGNGITKDGTNRVSVWSDKSLNGNNAIQPNSAAQPLWISNGINSLPSLSWDLADESQWMSIYNLTSFVQPNTVFVVAKWQGSSSYIFDGYPSILGGMENQRNALLNWNGGDISIYAGTENFRTIFSKPSEPYITYNSIIFNGANSKFYNRGLLIHQGDVGSYNSVGYTLGRRYDANGTIFSGYISEMLVFSGVLSDFNRQQVEDYLHNKYFTPPVPKLTFTGSTPAHNTVTGNNYMTAQIDITEANLSGFTRNWNGVNYNIYDSGLVLMMNFDNILSLGETTGSIIKDFSVYGNNGTGINNPTWISNGKFGGAYVFNGVDNYIDTSYIPDGGNMTLSYRVKYTKTNSSPLDGQHIGTHDGSHRLYLGINNGAEIQAGIGNTVNYTKSYVTTNQRYLLSLVISGGSAYVYKDGTLITGFSYTRDGNTIIPITIGKINGQTLYFITGSIDEVRIYDRALSSGEISTLYNSNLSKYDTNKRLFTTSLVGLDPGIYNYYGLATNMAGQTGITTTRTFTVTPPPPIAEWKFDICVGTTAIDSLGINTGTVYGAIRTGGYSNQGLKFTDVSYFTGQGYSYSSFTVSCWVKLSSVISWAGILEYVDENGNRRGIGHNDHGEPYIIYGDLKYKISTAGSLDNNWHHLLGTYDGITPKLYIDGSPVLLGTEYTDAYIGTNNLLSIGSMAYNSYWPYNGIIDEVQIYDYALTSGAVLSLYNSYGPESGVSCDVTKSYIVGYEEESDWLDVSLKQYRFTNLRKTLGLTLNEAYNTIFNIKNNLGRATSGDKLQTPFGFRAPVPDSISSGENVTVELKVKFFNLNGE